MKTEHKNTTNNGNTARAAEKHERTQVEVFRSEYTRENGPEVFVGLLDGEIVLGRVQQIHLVLGYAITQPLAVLRTHHSR